MNEDEVFTLGRGVVIEDVGYFQIGKITHLAIMLEYQIGQERYKSLWIPKSQIIFNEFRKCKDYDGVDRNHKLLVIKLSEWFFKKNEPFFKMIEKAEKDAELDEQYGGKEDGMWSDIEDPWRDLREKNYDDEDYGGNYYNPNDPDSY
ncbi:hypothetical protein [Parafilimonas terrae]|uniref:Uncharacterized protein n=1 Tax=Parafilimonas terrae TaxID=1465490 RepID=A0A1I5Y452_9BACT|nr:hypothetical protein [Parafilimonas terrae]SFQ38727.1 hypothetical protein SAMN05444277_110134 [Parafilimonas terrae]